MRFLNVGSVPLALLSDEQVGDAQKETKDCRPPDGIFHTTARAVNEPRAIAGCNLMPHIVLTASLLFRSGVVNGGNR